MIEDDQEEKEKYRIYLQYRRQPLKRRREARIPEHGQDCCRSEYSAQVAAGGRGRRAGVNHCEWTNVEKILLRDDVDKQVTFNLLGKDVSIHPPPGHSTTMHVFRMRMHPFGQAI